MTALIDIRHVSYRYTAAGETRRPALDDLSLQIDDGEYVVIVGANGSGKSTLARHLNALLIPQDGYVRVAGQTTRDPAHHPEIRRTVGMVFQRPEDQVVGTVVAHDVAFGLENLELPPEEIRQRVESTLRAVELWDDRDRPPHMLSAGQMQRLALAGILAMRPRCIVFDEATAMLDPAGRRATRRTMRDLHNEGLTILAITHRMDEALEADRMVVLHEGRVVLDDRPQRLFSNPEQVRRYGLDLPPVVRLTQFLAESMPELADATAGGRDPGISTGVVRAEDLILAIEEVVPAAEIDVSRTGKEASQPIQPGDTLTSADLKPVICVEGLGHTYMRDTPFSHKALYNVDLEVRVPGGVYRQGAGGVSPTSQETEHKGGAHGLIGATGSGKSTLLQHLNGLLRPQEGSVRVLTYDLSDREIDLREVRRQIGLVFQRPEAQIFEQYVGDEIAYGPRLAGLSGEPLRERVRWAMKLVGLSFEAFKDRYTFALSGGEQRKVALASILALRPQVLLLDEPTAGLDPASKADVMRQLSNLRQSDVTLILSSHEMEDIAALTDDVTVLSAGTVVLDGSTARVFSQDQQLRDWGLEVPVVTQVSEGLRSRGWPLPAGLVDAEHLRAALEQLMERAEEDEAAS